ncbi:MAG: hypothetical protein ACKO96_13665, partial [Flammeovirgaceae bacterium]
FQKDPKGQYFSPYVGMGNNPVSGVDPDGGWLFGLFGSTSADRQAARAIRDSRPGAEINNFFSKKISVTYQTSDIEINRDSFTDPSAMLFQSTIKLTTVKFDGKGTPLYKKFDVDFTASIVGTAEFNYNMGVDVGAFSFANAKGFGTGLSILSTSLTGYKVYAQIHQGGNPSTSDVISLFSGYVGVAANLSTRLGFDGTLVRFTGRAAGVVGAGAAVYENWSNIYLPMHNLRYAPSYIGNGGTPVYGSHTPGDF